MMNENEVRDNLKQKEIIIEELRKERDDLVEAMRSAHDVISNMIRLQMMDEEQAAMFRGCLINYAGSVEDKLQKILSRYKTPEVSKEEIVEMISKLDGKSKFNLLLLLDQLKKEESCDI